MFEIFQSNKDIVSCIDALSSNEKCPLMPLVNSTILRELESLFRKQGESCLDGIRTNKLLNLYIYLYRNINLLKNTNLLQAVQGKVQSNWQDLKTKDLTFSLLTYSKAHQNDATDFDSKDSLTTEQLMRKDAQNFFKNLLNYIMAERQEELQTS